MRAVSAILLAIIFPAMAATKEGIPVEPTPPVPSLPMTRAAIVKDAMPRKIEGNFDMPEQTLEERAAVLNELIAKLGYSARQLKVTVDPRVAKRKVGELGLTNPTLFTALKYTIANYTIRMEIEKGRINIIPMPLP